ncbi:MAG TPA: sulfite dehydrogenase [Gemmatimonadaceae bacterium]|nr:sulfite dehydrogenase [Gemmatimonadaceae bacterium]
MSDETRVTRRALITGAAVAAGGVLLEKLPLGAQTAQTAQPAAAQPDPSTVPGLGTTPTSARSPFETPARTPAGIITGPAYSPIHELTGTITPSDLVFERHHGGVAMIDPKKYKLLVHGLVDRAMVFTLDDLKQFPSVSRVHFLECSGNGRNAYRGATPELTPQMADGLTSNGEWTGVPLSLVLREAGVRKAATWFLGEGGDAAKLSRSIPIEKAWDDALLVYAFNGEALRPANGYPVRLFLPGYEANTCVKWLRRIKLVDQPNMSRDETAKYTDPLPNGTARQFSFVMDAKSVITRPTAPDRIKRGWHEISGLAWSGRGKITRVDVSTDGGQHWSAAELQAPVFSKAHTRFRWMWEWTGRPAVLMSRAVDETGYVQPTRAAFVEVRGPGTDFHFNYIRAWTVSRNGDVRFGVDL